MNDPSSDSIDAYLNEMTTMTRKSIMIAVGIATAFIALSTLAVADYYQFCRANQQLGQLAHNEFADFFFPPEEVLR